MRRLKKDGHLKNNSVYLTFDDGPEPDITEFILSELEKYDAKGTFFCVGKNVEDHPELFKQIIDGGHCIASHTYSHIHAFHNDYNTYINDVKRFDTLTNVSLFRPPYGALTLKTFLSIRKTKKIVLWHLSSNDWLLGDFDLEKSLIQLKKNTKKGKIILFHFCKKHEKETRQILPLYLEWLSAHGYCIKSL